MTAPAPPEPPGPSDLEGAGIVSGYQDLADALGGGDGFEIAFAAAGAALDTLGFVADPFGSLLGAGLGWAMEHVWFLNEPLDRLAGDPWRIEEQAKAWHGAALGLAAVAAAQRDLAGPRSAGWTGEAARAYRLAAADRAAQAQEMAERAEELAVLALTSGVAIGTLRSIVRDLIADLIGRVVAWAATGAVLAALTGGVSLAAAAGWIVLDALLLAEDIARRIALLLRSVAAAGEAAGGLAAGMVDAARRVGRVADDLHTGAVPVDEHLTERTPAGELVELGKQSSTAGYDDDPP